MKTTFEDVLREHNTSIAPQGHHHSRSGWIQFDCPFCGSSSHKYHMGFNLEDGYANCWNCGYHSVKQVLYAISGDWKSADFLSKSLKHPHTDQTSRDPHKRLTVLKLPPTTEELHAKHSRYLRSRGYDPHQIQRMWGVRSTTIAGRWSWRLLIPIHHKGRIVSWTSRAIGSKAPVKYLSASPEEELEAHKDLLYGEDYCREFVVIMEGPLDVWRFGPGAVATFGVATTQEQVRKLKRYPLRIICYDNEVGAQKQARKLYRQLSIFKGETINVQLDSADPGVMSKDELKDLRSLTR